MSQNEFRYNFCLVFEASRARAFRELSQSIVRGREASYQLDDQSEAHLTLLQFRSEVEDAAQLWDKLCRVVDGSITVRLNGLCFLPSSRGGLWAEIPVARSHELMAAQERALRVLGHPKPLNKVGELYRPHITLARLPSDSESVAACLDRDVVRNSSLACFLALGRHGEGFNLRWPPK